MKQTTIPGVEKAISQLFLGSMVFSPDRMDFSFSMLDQFFDAGGNAIDTAHGYGGGGSEITIGTWMATRNNRSDVFILDKGGPSERQGTAPTAFAGGTGTGHPREPYAVTNGLY